jgi:hypothetical protein
MMGGVVVLLLLVGCWLLVLAHLCYFLIALKALGPTPVVRALGVKMDTASKIEQLKTSMSFRRSLTYVPSRFIVNPDL